MKKGRNFLQKSKKGSRKALQQNDIKTLKENSDIFSFILHHNFNNSLSSNKFPKYFKKADITPIFKKDEHFLKTSYRPISILPTVSKIYERRLYDQINEYFQPLSQNYNGISLKDIVRNNAYWL